MLVCGLIIFELAIIIGLLVIAGRYAKQQNETWEERAILALAWLERFDRKFDATFNKELADKLNEVFRIGEKPASLVKGEDGKLHKVNRMY